MRSRVEFVESVEINSRDVVVSPNRFEYIIIIMHITDSWERRTPTDNHVDNVSNCRDDSRV